MAKQTQQQAVLPNATQYGCYTGETVAAVDVGSKLFVDGFSVAYQATRRDAAQQREQVKAALLAKYRM